MAAFAGIHMGPGDQQAFEDLTINLQSSTGYPYSDTSVYGPIFGGATGGLEVIGGSIATTSSTATGVQTLANAAQTPGPIGIVAYSGGAQTFDSAFQKASLAIQNRITNVVYISPGSIGEIATPPSTTVS